MQDADQSLASTSGHVMVGVLGPEGAIAGPCCWTSCPWTLSRMFLSSARVSVSDAGHCSIDT